MVLRHRRQRRQAAVNRALGGQLKAGSKFGAGHTYTHKLYAHLMNCATHTKRTHRQTLSHSADTSHMPHATCDYVQSLNSHLPRPCLQNSHLRVCVCVCGGAEGWFACVWAKVTRCLQAAKKVT